MKKVQFPHIGMRIVKTAVAVFITLMLSQLRADSLPIYAALAAMLCMQTSNTTSLMKGLDRIIDTLVGVGFGLATSLVITRFGVFGNLSLRYLLIGLVTMLVIYVTVLLKRPASSYFTWVVFLGIVLMEEGHSPIYFSINRMIDTLIGIGVSFVVNGVWLPRHRNRNTLFVSSFDGVLAGTDGKLPKETKVKLNRLLEKGAAITLATHRTPVTLLPQVEGVAFKLPLVVMNGAAIYEVKDRVFPFHVSIPQAVAREIAHGCVMEGVQCYQYAILHEELHVFCTRPGNAYEKQLNERLRKRMYQSYVNADPPEGTDILFLFFGGEREKIVEIERRMRQLPCSDEMNIVRHDTTSLAGYSNIEVSSVHAGKAKALAWLMARDGFEKMVAFGRGKTDFEMLKMADVAYRMEDATDEVVALGLPVAGTVAGGGVVGKMRRLLYRRGLETKKRVERERDEE